MSTQYGAGRESRIVRLEGTVDDDLANAVAARLLLLADTATPKDILLLVESPGGLLAAGMAIYDTMQYIPCDVATCAVGLTAGMGQLLVSAGAPGKRFAERDARLVMVGIRAGDCGQVDAVAMDRTRQRVAKIAGLHMGRDPDFVHAAWKTHPQREFSAEEARVYGLVDHVVERAPGR